MRTPRASLSRPGSSKPVSFPQGLAARGVAGGPRAEIARAVRVKADLEHSVPTSAFLGDGEAAKRIRSAVAFAARVDATVLITGESGTGKEIVAREIHARSLRSHFPFVAVNCAAIPETLWESEMFGHEAGAFTDARGPRRGAFEMAHTGTLFLDEIGDLPLPCQPKLLRVLESSEIQRVGGERPHEIDVRIIAATNHDLRAMSRSGAFRQDLYYRLRVFEIHVPPLRDRIEDIPVLVEHFASTAARRFGRDVRSIDPAVFASLAAHPWPGNVRELRSCVERAVAMASAELLAPQHFRLDSITSPGVDLRALLDQDWRTARLQFEKLFAVNLIGKHEGNVTKAAAAAGLVPRGLRKMLQRLGLGRATSREDHGH